MSLTKLSGVHLKEPHTLACSRGFIITQFVVSISGYAVGSRKVQAGKTTSWRVIHKCEKVALTSRSARPVRREGMRSWP